MASAKRICMSLDRTDKRQDPNQQQVKEETNTGNRDPFIGLDVCGRIYYCRQSTLANVSPYFNRRFKGDFDASISFIDAQGRTVYFVERPPTTFKYIFEYIVSGSTLTLPDFQTDPNVVRNLRTEADYFGLEHLCERLKVTKTIQPNPLNRGLLYWLGTKKGSRDYENPFSLGAIHIGGWMDDMANKDVPSFDEAHPAECRARFVEYRDPVKVVEIKSFRKHFIFDRVQNMFGCCMGNDYENQPETPVVLELKTLSLRPTHVSMRAALDCDFKNGMYHSFWRLEGSEDGSKWDRLSPEAQDKDEDEHKLNLMHHPLKPDPDDDEYEEYLDKLNIVEMKLAKLPKRDLSEEEMSKIMLDFLETECRETWKFEPPPTKFYHFFRIESDGGCFHVQGLELFGDVHEP